MRKQTLRNIFNKMIFRQNLCKIVSHTKHLRNLMLSLVLICQVVHSEVREDKYSDDFRDYVKRKTNGLMQLEKSRSCNKWTICLCSEVEQHAGHLLVRFNPRIKLNGNCTNTHSVFIDYIELEESYRGKHIFGLVLALAYSYVSDHRDSEEKLAEIDRFQLEASLLDKRGMHPHAYYIHKWGFVVSPSQCETEYPAINNVTKLKINHFGILPKTYQRRTQRRVRSVRASKIPNDLKAAIMTKWFRDIVKIPKRTEDVFNKSKHEILRGDYVCRETNDMLRARYELWIRMQVLKGLIDYEDKIEKGVGFLAYEDWGQRNAKSVLDLIDHLWKQNKHASNMPNNLLMNLNFRAYRNLSVEGAEKAVRDALKDKTRRAISMIGQAQTKMNLARQARANRVPVHKEVLNPKPADIKNKNREAPSDPAPKGKCNRCFWWCGKKVDEDS